MTKTYFSPIEGVTVERVEFDRGPALAISMDAGRLKLLEGASRSTIYLYFSDLEQFKG